MPEEGHPLGELGGSVDHFTIPPRLKINRAFSHHLLPGLPFLLRKGASLPRNPGKLAADPFWWWSDRRPGGPGQKPVNSGFIGQVLNFPDSVVAGTEPRPAQEMACLFELHGRGLSRDEEDQDYY